MDKIALLPALAVLLLLRTYGPEGAFLNIYIPVLFMTPEYHCDLPLFHPTFAQAAVIPVAISYLWRSDFRWRFSAMDVLVLAIAGWWIVTVAVNEGYWESMMSAAQILTLTVAPYLLGKELIAGRNLETKFAKRFVFLLFLASLISVYEFRMEKNLFKMAADLFFPSYASGAVFASSTPIRWGFQRVGGPTGATIPFGLTLMTAILVNNWLIKSGRWERDFRWFPGLPLAKGRILWAGLIMGSLMTMSRGPWLSGFFGAVLATVGTARNPRKTLAVASAFVALAGAGTWLATSTYTAVDTEASQQAPEEQASAAYRVELMAEYRDVALQRPVWGWGYNLPVIDGKRSIDNEFLLMALQSGVGELGLFWLFLLVMLIRMVWAGLNAEPGRRAVLFLLAGVWLSFIIYLGTVAMSEECESLIFLMAGWADGRILSKSNAGSEQTSRPQMPRPRFERVYT